MPSQVLCDAMCLHPLPKVPPADASDESLVIQVVQGDHCAREVLFRRVIDYARDYLNRKNRKYAEDGAQLTAQLILTSLEKFQQMKESSFRQWVNGFAWRVAAGYMREGRSEGDAIWYYCSEPNARVPVESEDGPCVVHSDSLPTPTSHDGLSEELRASLCAYLEKNRQHHKNDAIYIEEFLGVRKPKHVTREIMERDGLTSPQVSHQKAKCKQRVRRWLEKYRRGVA